MSLDLLKNKGNLGAAAGSFQGNLALDKWLPVCLPQLLAGSARTEQQQGSKPAALIAVWATTLLLLWSVRQSTACFYDVWNALYSSPSGSLFLCVDAHKQKATTIVTLQKWKSHSWWKTRQQNVGSMRMSLCKCGREPSRNTPAWEIVPEVSKQSGVDCAALQSKQRVVNLIKGLQSKYTP